VVVVGQLTGIIPWYGVIQIFADNVHVFGAEGEEEEEEEEGRRRGRGGRGGGEGKEGGGENENEKEEEEEKEEETKGVGAVLRSMFCVAVRELLLCRPTVPYFIWHIDIIYNYVHQLEAFEPT